MDNPHANHPGQTNDEIDRQVIMAIKGTNTKSINAYLRAIKEKTGLTTTQIIQSLMRLEQASGSTGDS